MVMKKTKARGGKMKMAKMRNGGMKKMRGGGMGMGMQPKTKARAGKMKMASKRMRGGMTKKK